MRPFTIEYPKEGKSEDEYCSVEHDVEGEGGRRMIFFTEILINIGLRFLGVFIPSE